MTRFRSLLPCRLEWYNVVRSRQGLFEKTSEVAGELSRLACNDFFLTSRVC